MPKRISHFIYSLFVISFCLLVYSNTGLLTSSEAVETIQVKKVNFIQDKLSSHQVSRLKSDILHDKTTHMKKRLSSKLKMKLLGTFLLTGYNPQSYLGKYCVTGSGEKAYQDVTVATDPSIIPQGSKIYVEGYGIRIATDEGTAIKGKRLDVYFNNLHQACEVGERNRKVYLITG